MDADRFLTHSLRAAPWGAGVARILAAALDAVEPAAAVRRFLRRAGDTLYAGEHVYDLTRYDRVFLVGAGKAGLPMAQAVAAVLGARLAGGVVVVKEGYAETRRHGDTETRRHGDTETRRHGDTETRPSVETELPTPDTQHPAPDTQHPAPNTRTETRRHGDTETDEQTLLVSLSPGLLVSEAGHPVPDERGVAGARRMTELLARATERDLVIAVLSGGGSALLTLPVPGVGLADIQALTAALLGCGASINEINTLRKHLDLLKGGGLARLAHPAALVTLVLSDVVGSPLDVIASGPTVPDPSTFADAWAVLERYGIVATVPPAIVEHLRHGCVGALPETPKPGDRQFEQVVNLVVGSNAQAAEAAVAAARAEGLQTLLLTTFMQGEAREVGRVLAAIGRELAVAGRPIARPACVVLGGETTVTLRGAGCGGRNQELALAAVADLAGLADLALVALATDGGDGPTDAAGAVVTGATLERARQAGLDPAAALARNDAYPFFAALDDLLRPGPTHTNVNDLALVFAF